MKYKKNLKIYIAGPMAGLVNSNFDEFDRVAADLKNKGFRVVNPADISRAYPGRDWAFYMKKDIPHLLKCGAVFAMKGYKFSRGALLEVDIAKALGMVIMDHDGYYISDGKNEGDI